MPMDLQKSERRDPVLWRKHLRGPYDGNVTGTRFGRTSLIYGGAREGGDKGHLCKNTKSIKKALWREQERGQVLLSAGSAQRSEKLTVASEPQQCAIVKVYSFQM